MQFLLIASKKIHVVMHSGVYKMILFKCGLMVDTSELYIGI